MYLFVMFIINLYAMDCDSCLLNKYNCVDLAHRFCMPHRLKITGRSAAGLAEGREGVYKEFPAGVESTG
jgi:hypothetical protein